MNKKNINMISNNNEMKELANDIVMNLPETSQLMSEPRF